MSEKYNSHEHNPAEYLAVRKGWVADTVEAITGDRSIDPLQVFPPATEVRSDGKSVVNVNGIEREITRNEENILREVGSRFGLGGETNVLTYADVQVMEGGKVWKIDAEAKITEGASKLFFAGSPFITIGDDEKDYLTSRKKIDSSNIRTEFDAATAIASSQPGFTGHPEAKTLPYGYDIHDNYQLSQEATGQFVEIGTISDVPVIMLRVDREVYVDESGAHKYRLQPDTHALLSIVATVQSIEGDTDSVISVNTSSTYASRAIDTVRAGIKARDNHTYAVGMYGRHTLAEVRGLPVEPSKANQLPGEFRVIAEKLQLLEQALTSNIE